MEELTNPVKYSHEVLDFLKIVLENLDLEPEKNKEESSDEEDQENKACPGYHH